MGLFSAQYSSKDLAPENGQCACKNSWMVLAALQSCKASGDSSLRIARLGFKKSLFIEPRMCLSTEG